MRDQQTDTRHHDRFFAGKTLNAHGHRTSDLIDSLKSMANFETAILETTRFEFPCSNSYQVCILDYWFINITSTLVRNLYLGFLLRWQKGSLQCWTHCRVVFTRHKSSYGWMLVLILLMVLMRFIHRTCGFISSVL